MGSSFCIFKFPDVEKLLSGCQNDFLDVDPEYLRQKAKVTFKDYYSRYSDRFEMIGWPKDFRTVGVPRVVESSDAASATGQKD